MTLAAGFHAKEGLLIFADTNVIMSDGTKKQGRKLAHVKGKSGVFGIANAAEDGNAANTLVTNILKEFEKKDFSSFDEIETALVAQMSTWAFAHTKPPETGLIFAAVWKGESRLYYCEPPNTILLKAPYAATGSGSKITDPLKDTLINDNIDVPVRVRLWQVAYLAYRAKKEDAWCGGDTNVLFFPVDGGEPENISVRAMEEAENFGRTFDFYLQQTLSSALNSHNEFEVKDSQDSLTQIMVMNCLLIAKHAFPPVVMPWDLTSGEKQ